MSSDVENLRPSSNAPRPKAMGAFGHRDYVLFWIGLLVSTAGSWMQTVALGWLVYDLTHSPFKLGLVTTAGTLPILLMTLHAGVVADRFDKRRIVIVTQTLLTVQASILAALALSHVIQVWHILVLAAFAGLVNAFDMPARQAMTIELVGRQDLLSAVSLNSSAFNVSRIVGPSIAGIIVAKSSEGVCFLVNAISFLAIIFMLLVIRPAPARGSSREESMLAQIKQGLAYVRRSQLMRNLLFLTGAGSLFVLQYNTLMPALARKVLGLGVTGYGTLMSMAGLGAGTAALSVAALGHLFKRGKLVIAGATIVPLGLAALALSGSYGLSLGCVAVTGFGMMLFLAVSNSLLQAESPEELRGRVLSVRTLVFMGLAPVGALLAGTLAQYYGVRLAILIGAGVFLVISSVISLASSALRSLE